MQKGGNGFGRKTSRDLIHSYPVVEIGRKQTWLNARADIWEEDTFK